MIEILTIFMLRNIHDNFGFCYNSEYLGSSELSYGLDDWGSIQIQTKIFYSPHVQVSSEAHQASYTISTRGSLSPKGKAPVSTDHSPPSSAKVKNISPYVFMESCLIMDRD
jgi:hypothetical protein